MGVIDAASKYFKLPWTVPELYVGGGHAFVTNISFDLCPSSPYVWQVQKTWPLYQKMNLEIETLGFLNYGAASAEQRKEFDDALMSALSEGKACSIVCLDHQIVTGYDKDGFTLAQPWGPMPDADPTPPRLNFGSWQGFTNGPPLAAFAMTHTGLSIPTRQSILKDSVAYAIDVWDNPKGHIEDSRYGMGPDAYPNWQKALDDGFGGDHGAWWNGTVWSECKLMASRYFAENVEELGLPDQLTDLLSSNYNKAARALMRASDRSAKVADQKDAVEEARKAETSAVELLRELKSLLH